MLEPVVEPTGLCWGFYFGLLLLEYLTCISWYVVRVAFKYGGKCKVKSQSVTSGH